MATKKTSKSKKSAAKKSAAKKSPTKKKTSAKKAPAKKAAAKKAPAKKASPPKSAPAGAGKGAVGVEAVNLGHVLALRPRVSTSFPQAEFLKARRELAGERFGSIEEAARAVAEKALAATNRKPSKHSIGR
jgi:hypothetical protein